VKLTKFDRGLHQRLAAHLVPEGYGVAATNTDYESGVLQPLASKLLESVAPADFAYFSTTLAAWRFTPVVNDYVEGDKKLIYTDRTTGLRVTDGTYDIPVGVQPMVGKASVAVVDIGVEGHRTDVIDQSDYSLTSSEITTLAKTVAGITILADSLAAGFSSLDYAAVPVRYSSVLGVDFPVRGTPMYRSLAVTSLLVRSVTTYFQIGFDPRVFYNFDPANPTTTFADAIELYRKFNGEWYLLTTLVDPANAATSGYGDTTYDLPNTGRLPSVLPRGTGFAGDIKYYITAYDPTSGFESTPTEIAAVQLTRTDELVTATVGFPARQVTATFKREQGVILSAIPTSATPKKRLYRLGGSLTVPTLVAELDAGHTVYADYAADDAVEGSLLDTLNTLPQVDLKYLTESNAILFAALGSKVYYSKIAAWHIWPSSYFLEFTQAVTGLAAVSGGLLVFTEHSTHLVTGTSHSTFATRQLCSDVGCLSHESVQVVSGEAVWLAHGGLFTSSGTSPKTLTRKLLGRLVLDVKDSALVDRKYYLLDTAGRILVVDFVFDVVQHIRDGVLVSLATRGADLYAVANTNLYKMFSGTTKLSLEFLPATVASSGLSQAKVFNRLKVVYTGSLSFLVSLDTGALPTVTLTTTKRFGTDYIQVPAGLTRSSSITMLIKGTGTLYELDIEEASANV